MILLTFLRLRGARLYVVANLDIRQTKQRRQDVSDEDVTDLKDRIEMLNDCTGRNDIEDVWKDMGVSEREKRQYRLSYNFFLVLLLFTDSLQSSSRYQ